MSAREKDNFEAVLRHGLRAASHPTDGCPTAEVVAAWHERTLSEPERESWAAHFAACDRCRKTLASLARIEGMTIESHVSWWRRFRFAPPALRWAGAGAAAMIALVLAIRLAPEAEKAPLIVTQARDQKKSILEKEEAPARAEKRAAAESAAEPKAPPAPAPVPDDRRATGDLARDRARPEPQAEAPPAAPAEPSRMLDERQEGSREGAAAGVPVGGGAHAEATSETGRMDSFAAKDALSSSRAAAPAAVRRAAPTVASPDGSFLWRVGGAGRIERSTDGGATWTVQSSGTGEDLLAADAPANEVCWVVGRNGTVLVTTDGSTWRRLEPPLREDLVTVSARDGKTATVGAASGRTLRTENGGETWVPVEP